VYGFHNFTPPFSTHGNWRIGRSVAANPLDLRLLKARDIVWLIPLRGAQGIEK
jgi:hypothetical protein